MEYLKSFVGGADESRMLRNFSLNEFALLSGTYKHMFKDQIRQPTADNNHIINYNLKMQNYVIVNSSIHMISAGMFTFLIKGVLGNTIDKVTINYLGQRKGMYAQIAIYIAAFYFSFTTLNNSKRLNVNHMINPRDFNGELMMNLVLKFYPQKVNQDKFRKILMDKYESQMIRINNFEQLMGTNEPHYKMINPNAVASYVQPGGGQEQQAPPATFPGMMPFGPGGPGAGGPLQMPGMQQQQQPQQNVQPHLHQQQQHQQHMLHPEGQKVGLPTNTQDQAKVEMLEQRTKIVDQLREQQGKSPYLSTNPLMSQPPSPAAQPATTIQRAITPVSNSPYFGVQQEILKENIGGPQTRQEEGIQNYYMQNIANAPLQQQQSQFKYQGHYYNVAQQAKKDSS